MGYRLFAYVRRVLILCKLDHRASDFCQNSGLVIVVAMLKQKLNHIVLPILLVTESKTDMREILYPILVSLEIVAVSIDRIQYWFYICFWKFQETPVKHSTTSTACCKIGDVCANYTLP